MPALTSAPSPIAAVAQPVPVVAPTLVTPMPAPIPVVPPSSDVVQGTAEGGSEPR
jgi:hypothetical protein